MKLTASKRTWTKKIRPIRIVGDVANIDLSQGHVAHIDASDIGIVQGYNWSVTEAPHYAFRGKNGRKIWMHVAVFGAPRPDHIDGNGLNNRRANLRLATAAQNARNRRKNAPTSSRFKGVSYRKDRGTWLAVITADGVVTKIGTFAIEEDAARAYDREAVRLFGEFAVLNFPSPEQDQ